MRIKTHLRVFCGHCELLLLLGLEVVSEWVGKAGFGFGCVLFALLYDGRVTLCWLGGFVIILSVILVCGCSICSIFEWIERQGSMNFSLGYIGIGIGIEVSLRFGLYDLYFLIVHEIEWVFELSG